MKYYKVVSKNEKEVVQLKKELPFFNTIYSLPIFDDKKSAILLKRHLGEGFEIEVIEIINKKDRKKREEIIYNTGIVYGEKKKKNY